MRITTQMLANSAAKSGIPIQRTSLLDIINNKSSQNLLGTIGKSMNTTSTGATDILRKNNYAKLKEEFERTIRETLEDLSEKLSQSASKLAGSDKDSIYDKAKESGDTTDILSDVNKMVEAYNATMKQLKTTGGIMNEFYQQQLKNIPAGSKESLESIGISQAKDGSLIVDEKVFRNADADTLQKVLGGENGIASKIGFLGEHINKNASENVVSASNRYGSNGATYMEAFEANKYNFFG